MKGAILTMFNGLSKTYSLVNVVAEHIRMLLDGGEEVKVLVSENCADRERYGIFLDERIEWVKVCNKYNGKQIMWRDYRYPGKEVHDTLMEEATAIGDDLIEKLSDVDVCMMHDIHYQGWHLGLDYYNHNLDTSPEFYGNIITTRTYQERLDTLEKVRDAGIKVCSGGIVGLGETVKDRAGLLLQLANLPTPPESVPINMLVKVKGTPLADNDDVDAFDFIRTIAVARIMMPTSYVRLSAGREQMNEQTQAMCFMAGANSIFYGCKLLTTPNPEEDKDLQLFRKLGLNPQQTAVLAGDNEQQQRLEQALMTPDTDEYYNAAAL